MSQKKDPPQQGKLKKAGLGFEFLTSEPKEFIVLLPRNESNYNTSYPIVVYQDFRKWPQLSDAVSGFLRIKQARDLKPDRTHPRLLSWSANWSRSASACRQRIPSTVLTIVLERGGTMI